MVFLNKSQAYSYITALVAAFPLLGQKISVFAIILWCVYSLFIMIKMETYRIDKKDFRNIIILSALYLSYIFSYFFATDKHEVAKLLERNMPFLLFPVFMIINRQFISKKTLRLSLLVFIVSSVLLCLYVWGVILSQDVEKIFKEDHYYNPVIRNIFSDTTKIHLPYLGMLFVFAALILLYEMLTAITKNYFILLVQALGIILLLGSVATFMARTSLFTFFIVAIIIVLKKIKSLKQLLVIGVLGVIFTTAILMLPSSQRRIKEGLSAKYELPHAGQPSEEVNFRYGIYNCVKAILRNNWLTGVGVDNVQKELDACYSQYTYRGTDDFNSISYNSHNQYLDITLKYGVFGLMLFLVSLLWGIKNTNTLYQGFIIIIFIALLTENMFTRQVGVIFFTFFNTIFFVTRTRRMNIERSDINEIRQ